MQFVEDSINKFKESMNLDRIKAYESQLNQLKCNEDFEKKKEILLELKKELLSKYKFIEHVNVKEEGTKDPGFNRLVLTYFQINETLEEFARTDLINPLKSSFLKQRKKIINLTQKTKLETLNYEVQKIEDICRDCKSFVEEFDFRETLNPLPKAIENYFKHKKGIAKIDVKFLELVKLYASRDYKDDKEFGGIKKSTGKIKNTYQELKKHSSHFSNIGVIRVANLEREINGFFKNNLSEEKKSLEKSVKILKKSDVLLDNVCVSDGVASENNLEMFSLVAKTYKHFQDKKAQWSNTFYTKGALDNIDFKLEDFNKKFKSKCKKIKQSYDTELDKVKALLSEYKFDSKKKLEDMQAELDVIKNKYKFISEEDSKITALGSEIDSLSKRYGKISDLRKKLGYDKSQISSMVTTFDEKTELSPSYFKKILHEKDDLNKLLETYRQLESDENFGFVSGKAASNTNLAKEKISQLDSLIDSAVQKVNSDLNKRLETLGKSLEDRKHNFDEDFSNFKSYIKEHQQILNQVDTYNKIESLGGRFALEKIFDYHFEILGEFEALNLYRKEVVSIFNKSHAGKELTDEVVEEMKKDIDRIKKVAKQLNDMYLNGYEQYPPEFNQLTQTLKSNVTNLIVYIKNNCQEEANCIQGLIEGNQNDYTQAKQDTSLEKSEKLAVMIDFKFAQQNLTKLKSAYQTQIINVL